MSACLLVSLALAIFIKTSALCFSLLQVSLTFSQEGLNYYFILFILCIVSGLVYCANKIWGAKYNPKPSLYNMSEQQI